MVEVSFRLQQILKLFLDLRPCSLAQVHPFEKREVQNLCLQFTEGNGVTIRAALDVLYNVGRFLFLRLV